MIAARTFARAYLAVWLLCLFGSVCFAVGIAVAVSMAVAMLEVAR